MQTTSNIYRFFSLSMAVVIFITTVGFTVDLHYCGGQLKTFNFIGKAKSCHEKAMVQCPHHKKMMLESGSDSVDTKSCCNNRTLHFQSDQDKVIQLYDIKASQSIQQFVTAFVTVFLSDPLIQEAPLVFARYKPPLIQRDIPVLIQSFRL